MKKSNSYTIIKSTELANEYRMDVEFGKDPFQLSEKTINKGWAANRSVTNKNKLRGLPIDVPSKADTEVFYQIHDVNDLKIQNINNLLSKEEAEKALKKSSDTLLKYRAGQFPHLIKKVAFITDIRFCDVAMTNPLAKIAKELDLEMVIFHVNVEGLPHIENEFAEEIFKEYVFPRLGCSRVTFVNLEGHDSIDELDTACSVMSPDLLTVSRSKCGLYKRLFTSASDEELEYNKIPLLIYP